MSDIEDRIRERAYKLWEEEGYPDGKAEAHWEKARELIEAEDSEPPGGVSRAIAQEGFARAGASGVRKRSLGLHDHVRSRPAYVASG